MSSTIFNPQLLSIARATLKQSAAKRSFVDAAAASGAGGDPAAAGGDPMAAAMGGDPAAMGGAAGGDPAAMGGAPAAPPPGDPRIDQLMTMMQQMMSSGGAGGGGAAAGGVEPIKPKIDVNVEIMQMKKLMARMADHLGIPIPASEMVATTQDLTQMGMQDQTGAGAGAAPPTSAITPPKPLQPAMPTPAGGGGGGGEKTSANRGSSVPRMHTMRDLGNQASAMAAILRSSGG